MAISQAPWGSITAADFATPEAYCSSCLIDLNEPGARKSKGNCKLPVKMPNGDMNANAVHAAAAVLAGGRGGVDAPPDQRRAAARKLLSMYAQMKQSPPDSLTRLAGG